ncbi:MAG: hypothetical protein ACKPBU_00490 [Alphaproteobacteria bacterium]
MVRKLSPRSAPPSASGVVPRRSVRGESSWKYSIPPVSVWVSPKARQSCFTRASSPAIRNFWRSIAVVEAASPLGSVPKPPPRWRRLQRS